MTFRGKAQHGEASVEWRAYPPGTYPIGSETRLKPEYDRPENYMVSHNEWGARIIVIRPVPDDWLETITLMGKDWLVEGRVRCGDTDLAFAQLLDCQGEQLPRREINLLATKFALEAKDREAQRLRKMRKENNHDQSNRNRL